MRTVLVWVNSRWVRFSILDLLGARVELKEVISHRQLMTKLSDLAKVQGANITWAHGYGHHIGDMTQTVYVKCDCVYDEVGLYLFLCNFKLFIQYFIACRQFLVLLQKGLTDPRC